jgi:hypothetical protein
MKQNHPIPRSRTILCLALLAGGALFAADTNPDGWVVAVGQWTRGKQVLQQYDAVFANDKLQGTSGTIVVALKDGQSPHPYHCDKFPCTVTIPGFRPVEDSLLSRLGRAFSELSSHRETMPVSAISRGREPLQGCCQVDQCRHVHRLAASDRDCPFHGARALARIGPLGPAGGHVCLLPRPGAWHLRADHGIVGRR